MKSHENLGLIVCLSLEHDRPLQSWEVQMSSGIGNRKRREMSTLNTDYANNMPSIVR